ncbi:MAG: hypothetical protein WDO74_21655 [Pseudomonadota bacterium]
MRTPETKADHAAAHAAPGPLEKVLSIFADTHAGEGTSALLLTFSVFFLLVSYYLIKTAREPLILASGAEIKSYASVGQTLLLLPTTYFYGVLSHKVGRIKLITIVTLIFVSNLFLFFGLNAVGVPIGLAFYLWAGVFNMLSVAQFGASPPTFTLKSRVSDCSRSSASAARSAQLLARVSPRSWYAPWACTA